MALPPLREELALLPGPTLADGQYTVSLTTQYSGSRNVKEPRTYTFPIILIVGEGGGGDSESPDEI